MNQIVTKVAPALAAGCTRVLKPREMAPLSARLFAQILHEAAVPHGVFNLANGDGPTVGAALASHPDVATISFTGSNRAGVGIAVAVAAAPAVKRVTQELGGKSANILLDDADPLLRTKTTWSESRTILPKGLSGFVTSGNLKRARRARRIRSGNVHVNGARVDFGGRLLQTVGQRQRMGEAGPEEFLELRTVFGYAPAK
jgi:acyl-CoA reductase-like NAD-dependent aldehyde dehydrogenase